MREAGATTAILHRSLIQASPTALRRIGNNCSLRRCPDMEITFFAASAVAA
jgi:hypothetical protein